ncbi:hypothetical protein ABIA33_006881 [Streptacidiphilus sp. MAP12-16]
MPHGTGVESALYVQRFIDNDERVREGLTLGTERGVPLMEAPRQQLDNLAEGHNHPPAPATTRPHWSPPVGGRGIALGERAVVHLPAARQGQGLLDAPLPRRERRRHALCREPLKITPGSR